MTEPTSTFSDLGLDGRLLSTLRALGFEHPTPIQELAIPPLLEGRDVIGRARTGSGKTAAYGLPLLHRVQEATGPVRALVLAPTRELAMQVSQAITDLARDLPVRTVTIYGGAPYGPQLKALRSGVPIVVGTPGRVMDHMDKGSLDLSQLEVLVLDEADEMLRMGFIDAVEAVLKACPPDRQVALLSATMPADIQRVASSHLRNPVELQLDDEGPRVDHIDQRWIKVPQRQKLEGLHRLLQTSPPGATVVFARTRLGCAEVADALSALGIPADALHGDMNQAGRERVVERLRAGATQVVVATDVAARGLDIDHVARVVNLDLPDDVESYVHRIGRTARAGREGEAISFVTPPQQRRMQGFARELGATIRRSHLPSDQDIAQFQQGMLCDDLADLRDRAPLDGARAFARQLAAQPGWDLETLAATALAALADQRHIHLDGSAPPPEPRPVRAPAPRTDDPPPTSAPRSAPQKPPSPRAIQTEPAAFDAPPSPPRREPPPPGEAPVAPRLPPRRRDPADRDARSDRRAPAEGPEVEVFFSIGEAAGLRPGDLVGALVNEAGLTPDALGRISIFEHKSFVAMPLPLARDLLQRYREMDIRGQTVRLDKARGPGGPRSGPPRGRGRGGPPSGRGGPPRGRGGDRKPRHPKGAVKGGRFRKKG